MKGPMCIFEDCTSGGDLATDNIPEVALVGALVAIHRKKSTERASCCFESSI